MSASASCSAPRAHTLVPGKHRFITTERIEKFTSKQYWTDCNLTSVETRLCSKECVVGEVTVLRWTEPKSVYEAVRPGYDRSNVTFRDAKNVFDHPDQAEALIGGPSGNKVLPAAVGDRFGGLNTNHWFKVTVKIAQVKPLVPGHKVDIRLAWSTGSEGLVYREDGTAVSGVTGEGRDFVPLWYDVAAGSSLNLEQTVYIEMVCSARMGDGKPTFISDPDMTRHFTLDRVEIMLIDRMIRRLKSDMELLHSFATTDGVPDVLAEDALAYGNRVINAFAHDQPETYKVAAQVAEEFFKKHSAPRPDDPRDTIAALGNCHIDTAWLWRYRETRRKIARSWASQLLLTQAPDRQGNAPYTFIASQAIQFQWLLEDYPELFARIKTEIIRSRENDSRFIALGATWVEADGNLPSGESFVRQFLMGQNFFKKHFGFASDLFFLPDTFGYSSQLPQIARHCGAKYFVSQKLSWNLINKPPHTTFYWRGIDGVGDGGDTMLLAHFPPQDNYCCQVTVDEVVVKSAVAKQNRDLGRARNVLLLFGDGDGGGGPTEPLLHRLDRFEKMTTIPLKVSANTTPLQHFKRLEDDDKKCPQLQTHVGELYFEMHRGTFSVHRRLKHRIALLEDLLRAAESTAAFAAIASSSYQHPTEQLRQIWSDVLLSQFHDVIPGSSITLVYVDTFAMLDRAIEVANKIIRDAAQLVVVGHGQGNKSKLTINMAPVSVDGVKPFSIAVGQVAHSRESSGNNNQSNAITVTPLQQQEKGSFQVQNSKMTCVVEPDGRISSFKLRSAEDSDQETGSGLAAADHVGGANKSWLHWCLYDDVPLFWDAWDVEIYHLEKPLMSHGAKAVKATSLVPSSSSSSSPTSTSTVELVTELSVLHDITIEQRLIFSADSADIRVRASVKNWANAKSKHRFLKCLFGCNIVNQNAFFGTAFGAAQRPTHRNSSQDLAKFEVCADRWLDFSQPGMGLSIANNCGMRGASVHGSTVHLSVLRAPTSPDPTCDVGDHDLEFVLRPHNKAHYSESGIVDLAASLSKPIHIEAANEGTEQQQPQLTLAKASSRHLHITAVKLPEYHVHAEAKPLEVIVRLYETTGSYVPAGHTLELFAGSKSSVTTSASACSCDGLEVKNLGDLVAAKNKMPSKDNEFVAFSLPEFAPFQIRTIKVSFAKST